MMMMVDDNYLSANNNNMHVMVIGRGDTGNDCILAYCSTTWMQVGRQFGVTSAATRDATSDDNSCHDMQE